MAIAKIVAGIFILSLIAITESLKVSCKPDCSTSLDLGKVEDPFNCTNYYMCYNKLPMNHPTPCPNGGTFYNTYCGLPSVPPCEPTCAGGYISNCNINCIPSVTTINDPSNCGTYYVCYGDVPGPPASCPANLPHYDSINDNCVNDPSVCCEFTCEPICDQPQTVIPDYYDCTYFYWCDTVGVPSDHFPCPNPGETVDLNLKTCGINPKWQSSCSASPSPVPPTGECAESMTCIELGYFPKCLTCNAEFFFCEHIGQPAVVQKCTGLLLFSTDPMIPYCVLPADCH